jgi:hypothetical protein
LRRSKENVKIPDKIKYIKEGYNCIVFENFTASIVNLMVFFHGINSTVEIA